MRCIGRHIALGSKLHVLVLTPLLLPYDVQVTGVWGQLQRLKQIVPEPRKAGDEFDAAIAQYYKAVAEGRGGLFMAVCRGKVRQT